MALPASALHKLQRVFEFDQLRDGQEAVVSRLLAGKSVVAIFPTGGGKSLCYQLPALEFPELTLVVSPLIALMKDQLDFLARKGIAAARIDSTLPAAEYRQVMDDLSHGRLRLLYVAPERLGNERFLQVLKRLKLALMAVDEAHCISEWGHNFLPDYLKLARLARELKVPRVLALTATAPPAVAQDIARSFGIAADDIIRTGFHRPNLHLYVTPCHERQRDELLARRLSDPQAGPSIVYVTLQRTAEDVAGRLANSGLPARAYHAGLAAEERTRIQDWFMSSRDAIVVATIAFGLGIDKADIRRVIHYNLPKSLENYAQEVGRAGRDGIASRCELLACGNDQTVLENFTHGDTPTPEAVEGVIDHVLSLGEKFDISTYELAGEYDIRQLVLETLLTYLELDGVLSVTGPFYNSYEFQPLRNSTEILAKFDPARKEFLARLFRRARRKKTWFEIDVASAVAALKEPRERIIAALNYLEEQGDLTLKVSGVRVGYRRLTRPVREPLLEKMTERFLERENRDIQRLRQVIDFANHAGCKTRLLATYFGEDLPGDCGHCGWCNGDWTGEMPPRAVREFTPLDAKLRASLVTHGHEALRSPRQRARYLCGLASPAAQRARLTRDVGFGALADVPFQRVLEWVETSG